MTLSQEKATEQNTIKSHKFTGHSLRTYGHVMRDMLISTFVPPAEKGSAKRVKTDL